MNVVIIGAGEVGFHIADRLSREGHSVTVVESDPARQSLLHEKVNAMVVPGSGASTQVLEQAGVANADLFIAVTDLDEVNLVACILAAEYGVGRKIARVKSGHFSPADGGRFNAAKLGIDLIINPESVVAEEILNVVAYSNATEVAEFADGRVVFLGYPIHTNSPVAGVSMRDLGAMRGIYRFVITAIARGNKTLIPRGDDTIEIGDVIYFVCQKQDLPAVQYLFGLKSQETHDVFVLGAGRVGAELARRMAQSGYRVKVIDRNRKHCTDLAQELDRVLVLNTDGTDVATLVAEGIDKADAYLAVTQDDQANILCSLLAKRYGARRAIALVDHHEFVTLAPSLGVDACISPRLATASAILKYVRRGEVTSIAMVEQCDAEVLEFVIPAGSPVAGKRLSELNIPSGANVGAIVRGDRVIIPGGEDVLNDNDHVIMFALPEAVSHVESFISGA